VLIAALRRRIIGFLMSQFGHPRGLAGRVVGAIMAFENRERNAWAVRLLDVGPADRALEIGFGPGLAIAHLTRLAADGLVAGVDSSGVMVRQARARNAAAIRAGRADLRLGSADALPFPDADFDKVLAVNSLHHWPDPAAGLREVRRVLRPGGLVAIVEQPRAAGADQVRERRSTLAAQLTTAGFARVQVECRQLRRGPCLVALAENDSPH
jgi:ubiquinone/menaquinone biosynthesis C-methylase UbiE